ncbi:hypothetical protein Tco_0287706 [Tanacetum coccineum]
MANLSEDIQCAGSDTRPPMLDRTDFASWQQRIRLYCRGKENGVNILKSIDEGPFQMGTFRETLAEGNEGALHLGPERARVYSDLSPEDKERFTKLINDMRNIKMTMPRMQLNSNFVNNMLPEWGRFVTIVKLNRGLWDSNYDQLYAYLKQHEAHANENKMMLERFTQPNVDPLALMSNVSHQQYYSQSSTTPPSTHVQPHFADNIQLNSGLSPTENLIENLTNTLALLTQSYKTYLPQTNNQLRTSSNTRNQATVQDGRVVVQNVQGRQNRGQGNNARGTGAAVMGAQNRVGSKSRQASRLTQENRVTLDEEWLLFIACGQDNVVDEDVDEQPVQDLALNVDNVFQADDCDAFDSDVDEAPTAQTMFMANLSSPDPGSYLRTTKHHEVHEMHDDVQPNYVVDSHTDYASDSNMIPYDQYVKDNAVSVVQSNVSSVPNDAYMMIINEMHEQTAQSVYANKQNKVVNASLTAELATYKEQVELYERRAKFELTEREQKIEEQLRIVITDRNIKEENLKKELHSVKMQLTSTINHNKSMVEEKKVAIGYKNPLCLTRAKQVQPALYNGHEIIKTNHVPAIVHNSEDTLEIAEITRKKMNDKMKTPLWTEQNINIRPPDYSKENYLATFTPQTQLTPGQIFWSKDVLKMKAEALKEQTPASRPIKALTVYPPNTPATLVPRVLPTKSQVKINIFALIQLFSEFEKTCKKRITPTGLTEGERGFEQTKECYLTEVIPFFKTLKEHFEGIQKALTKEIKEMKEIFEELEAEVDQNVVNRKFIEMHDAHTIVQTCCLELEAELSNLRDKLKYQNLKESFRNIPPPPVRVTPNFDSVFVIGKMKASLQGKDNAIKKLKMQISQLKETRSKADRTLDFRALDFHITHLTKKVIVLQEQNELFRAENKKVKQHYKELYDSI